MHTQHKYSSDFKHKWMDVHMHVCVCVHAQRRNKNENKTEDNKWNLSQKDGSRRQKNPVAT